MAAVFLERFGIGRDIRFVSLLIGNIDTYDPVALRH